MTVNTRTFIIAEAGVNHNGSLDKAMQLIDVAAMAGADAVKFQTFKADKLVSRTAIKAEYQYKTTDVAESQYEMLKKLELDFKSHKMLVEYCVQLGIQFISTPFDIESVEMLVDSFGVSRLKLSSGEITNGPLLMKAAKTGKSIFLSTGMSTLGEIETALGVLAFGYTCSSENPSLEAFQRAYLSEAGQAALKEKVVLLHCTSEYPAMYGDANLKAMDTIRTAFQLKVGLSDHTPGIVVPLAAVARGAVVIEKHFTLDKNLPGPDHAASLEPGELKMMVKMIRQVEEALGSSTKGPSPPELNNKLVIRKSIVAAQDIKKGEVFTEANIEAKRPGSGISPMYYWGLLGRLADRDFEKDEVVEL